MIEHDRRDSFITHRAFCDALAEESARLNAKPLSPACWGGGAGVLPVLVQPPHAGTQLELGRWLYGGNNGNKLTTTTEAVPSSMLSGQQHGMAKQPAAAAAATYSMSATALLHKAVQMGAVTSAADVCHINNLTAAGIAAYDAGVGMREETRDFLGVGLHPLGSSSLPPLHGWPDLID